MKIEFTIPGPPKPLARPRFSRAGIVYNKQKSLMDGMKSDIFVFMGSREPLYGPIDIELEFHMPIPASLSKKMQRQYEHGYHTSRPDLDNCCKMVLDLCNGIVFHDDSQVCFLNAFKLYSKDPRTVVRVFTLPHADESIDED